MLVRVSEVDPEVLSIHWRMQPPATSAVRNYLLLETASVVLSHKVLSKDIWRRGNALIEENKCKLFSYAGTTSLVALHFIPVSQWVGQT